MTNPPKSRRAGGRQARQALRAAPLAEDIKPIRPGMLGGVYRPLSEADVRLIHEGALRALAEIGLADAPESGIAAMTAAGASLGEDGRLRFPRGVVEWALEAAERDLTLHGRDPAFDIHPSGKRVYFSTAGAAVHMVDLETGAYRDPTTQDLYDAARLAQRLDNIHMFQRPVTIRDVETSSALDLNTLYACIAGTTKHIGVSFVSPQNVADGLAMLHLAAGGEDAWRARPFVSNTNCFVVPPMKFATESCQVMEAVIEGGMPVLLLSAGQAGATAPAALAGAVMQATAECLAGVVYVNAIKPGHPAIFGTWPFVSDLRTGAMSGGSGEQALLAAACAQMHHFYGLPGGAASGMIDAKTPDMQAGYESGVSNVMAALSGLNIIYESAGMHASLLGFCLESLLIGDDLIGQSLRCLRGVEVTEETVSLEVMRKVCLEGPGHYLGSEQTLNLMQRDYVYPRLGDRTSPKEWAENGKPELLKRAGEIKAQWLAESGPQPFPEGVDDAIRARFDIRLPRETMGGAIRRAELVASD